MASRPHYEADAASAVAGGSSSKLTTGKYAHLRCVQVLLLVVTVLVIPADRCADRESRRVNRSMVGSTTGGSPREVQHLREGVR
jgi:hypothetical protein